MFNENQSLAIQNCNIHYISKSEFEKKKHILIIFDLHLNTS